ncbi:MAG: CBS domain-containing protein [Verrucomicrobiota bacterium]|nr:CBS domain-containing protein [Verrucomicrobiota bacterium]
MTQEVEVVRPDAPLQEAAEKMRSLEIGMLPVCENDRLVGMLTDRDIAVRATAAGDNPNETLVRETMTPEVIYCFEDQDSSEAAQVMAKEKVARLAVVNRDKRLVGIVSLADLAVRSGDEPARETLSKVARPEGDPGTGEV